MLIIDRGRAVASGTTADITAGTSTQAAVLEVDRAIDVDSLARHLGTVGVDAAGDVTVEATGPNRYRITGAATPRGIAAMTAWCADHDVLVSELRVARRSLEDVFLDITGREMRS